VGFPQQVNRERVSAPVLTLSNDGVGTGRWSAVSALALYADAAHFPHWLDEQLYFRFGRKKSNRAISVEAGLAENGLYRVLTKGDRPSPDFCARIAGVLDVSPEVVLRHAGLMPISRVSVAGECELAEGLTEQERRWIAALLQRVNEVLVRETV
jgi:hypothetical protein